MSNPTKGGAASRKTRRLGKRSWRSRITIVLKIALAAAVLGYLTHGAILAAAGRFLVVSEDTSAADPADVVVVLGGGDPARALEAAALYREGRARFVLLTTENPPRIFEQLKRDGIELYQTFENYQRVLAGYGVPQDHILRVEEPVGDTLDEIQKVRAFLEQRQWRKLIVVTSNFHTRRAKLVARFVLEPSIHTTVVACRNDSFDPETWWKTQGGIRTFAIEAEKLVSYSVYLWPKLFWRR